MTDLPLRAFNPEEMFGAPEPDYLARRSAAKLFKQYATLLDLPVQYTGTKRVRRRGERLSRPVYWKGRQWAVTRYGVEARDGRYFFEHRRINENEDSYGWVTHMSGKGWVDIADFAEALR